MAESVQLLRNTENGSGGVEGGGASGSGGMIEVGKSRDLIHSNSSISVGAAETYLETDIDSCCSNPYDEIIACGSREVSLFLAV